MRVKCLPSESAPRVSRRKLLGISVAFFLFSSKKRLSAPLNEKVNYAQHRKYTQCMYNTMKLSVVRRLLAKL